MLAGVCGTAVVHTSARSTRVQLAGVRAAAVHPLDRADLAVHEQRLPCTPVTPRVDRSTGSAR